MKLNNIIDLGSYIKVSSIRESFEKDCLFVSSIDDMKEIGHYRNIIFETSQLKIQFYDKLEVTGNEFCVVNCLSSDEIFNEQLSQATGTVIFDNVCSCRNLNILEKVIEYKNKKLLIC